MTNSFRAGLLVSSCLVLFAICGCNRLGGPPSASPSLPAFGSKMTIATPERSGPRFVDIAESSGLLYRWRIPGKSPVNVLQTIGNGCAFLDYDNDGNLDILLVGPAVALYKGNGHGRFTDVSRAMGLSSLTGAFLGCAVGDYDNDGFDDIYISAYRGGALLHNEAGKRFRDVTKNSGIAPQPWGTSCAFVDADGDGRLDLYICNYVNFGPTTQPQLCSVDGTLTACGPRFYQPERGVMYWNRGSGRFQNVTARWGAGDVAGKALGIACASLDESGRPGIAIANDEMPGDLLVNVHGQLKNVAVDASVAHDSGGNVHGGMGLDWGDYDNDGQLDLAVGTFYNESKCIYHNDGHMLFAESSATLGIGQATLPYVTFGIKWLDYDNDGWLDLVLANGHVQDNIEAIDKAVSYRQPTQLFHNSGGRSFEDVSQAAGASLARKIVGRGLAVGDFDNDGRVDILVVDSDGAPLLLHNETPTRGHWLICRLIGSKSNRDGIGAVVTVKAGGIKLVRQCATDGSYMSASDRRVHFGLGAATTAELSVRWPGDRTLTTYRNVPGDQVVTLREDGLSAQSRSAASIGAGTGR